MFWGPPDLHKGIDEVRSDQRRARDRAEGTRRFAEDLDTVGSGIRGRVRGLGRAIASALGRGRGARPPEA